MRPSKCRLQPRHNMAVKGDEKAMDIYATAGMAILMAASVTGSPKTGQNRLIRGRARVNPGRSSPRTCLPRHRRGSGVHFEAGRWPPGWEARWRHVRHAGGGRHLGRIRLIRHPGPFDELRTGLIRGPSRGWRWWAGGCRNKSGMTVEGMRWRGTRLRPRPSPGRRVGG
jgi:hypothetical protein